MIDKGFEIPKYIQDLLDEKEKHSKIDRLSLDEHWERQSYLFLKYADALSDMKRKLDIYISELDDYLRKLFTTADKKPPSEAKMDGAIKRDNKYIEMCYVVSRLENAVKMMDMRKKSLEGENQLFIGGYFSVPNHRKLIQNTTWNKEVSEKINKQREIISRRRRFPNGNENKNQG